MLPQPGLRAVNLQKARLLERLHNNRPDLATELRAVKLDWYTMRNQAGDTDGDGVAEIYVYDEIGGSFGVGAKDFIDELNEITTPEIVVRINSPGGLLIDAIAICSALAQHPSKIITRVDGIAASAASLIAVSGDVCEAGIGSQIMIHDVMCNVMGNARDMRDAVDWLEAQSENVAAMYARKAGGDASEWRNLMLAETWMFAEEAVTTGLLDNIFERSKNLPELPPAEEDEEEAPEKEGEEEESTEPEEDDEEMSEDEALDALMHRKHRLTNRGFKYLGRNRAPAPMTQGFADLIDMWR